MFSTSTKKKLLEAEYRIKDLEERLCPCEQHDWIRISRVPVVTLTNDAELVETYRCKTCGKMKKEYDRL